MVNEVKSKKILTILIISLILALIIGIDTNAKGRAKKIYFNDVTTLNFVDKTSHIKSNEIKTICTYDYCDYARASTKEESIEIFTNNYLNTISDSEVKASLKIKGIKITEITLY